ncbi:lipopolysaccharide biosynthesis protein [Roseibium aggregatum]|uniref:Oligosaccharide flippase family protein n=1 Tax=Roseibium aggregatum TaxID=187304 RepID=A0A926P6K9_9HYPH|nr:polysaccharide biosynthesis C-terminal domain-containing protein [Roseibium aggregatum]MBD1548957.1 oligosaccharide flippase family protein [Roseibium aggregatum]
MQSLISASIINTVAGMGSLVAGLFSTILIARILGADGTGSTAFALWLVFSATALADRGTPSILLRYMARGSDKRGSDTRGSDAGTSGSGLLRALYPRFLWPTVVVFACFVIYAVWAGQTETSDAGLLWAVTAIIFLIYAHGNLAIGAARGLGQFSQVARYTAIGCFLQIPAVIAGAYFFGAPGAMLGYLVRHLPQGLAVRHYLEVKPRPSQDAVTDQMRRYGRNSWISGGLHVFVRTRIEFLFIGWFFTITEVGYFAAGMTFNSLVIQLAMFMLAGLTPGFGRLHDTENDAQFALSYQRALRWMSLFLMPACFGGAAVMPALLPLVFGSEFVPAVHMSIVLTLFTVAQALALIPMAAMQARERDQTMLHAAAISAVVLIALNLAITPFYGGEGAAWVRAGVNIVTLAWLLWHNQKHLKLPAPLSGLARISLASALCAGAAYGLLLVVPGLAGLCIAIPAGALVYLLALRLLRAIPNGDIDSLTTSLRKALPGRLAGIAVSLARLLRTPQPAN